MDDCLELDEDELLGLGETQENFAFSEEEERRLLGEDLQDCHYETEEDYYDRLDYEEDSSVNYNEINISENCDEFYEEAENSDQERMRPRFSKERTDEEGKKISNDDKVSDVLTTTESSVSSQPIENVVLESPANPESSTSNHNKFDPPYQRRFSSFQVARPQRWHSPMNQRHIPPSLPRGRFPLNQRPVYPTRSYPFSLPRSQTAQLSAPILLPPRHHFNTRNSWISGPTYPLSAPFPNFPPSYSSPVNLPTRNRPPINIHNAQRPTIHVNPHFQGSVKLQPNMPRLAWHEVEDSISASNSHYSKSSYPDNHIHLTNNYSVDKSFSIPHPQSLLNHKPTVTTQPDTSQQKNLNLLDTAFRRRKMLESLETSAVSPPKRPHLNDSDVLCLEDNNVPPTDEELQKAKVLGVDVAYLREYEKKQKEIKEKSAIIAKEKEDKRKQKILEAKILKITESQPKTAVKENTTPRQPISFATQPTTSAASNVSHVRQKPLLTPQERLKRFSQPKPIKLLPIQAAQHIEFPSQDSRSVVSSTISSSSNDAAASRSVIVDKTKSIDIPASIPKESTSNRTVVIKKPSTESSDKKELIKRSLCVSNLLPVKAESDMKAVMRTFGGGKLRRLSNNKTMALVEFETESEAESFLNRVNGIRVRGVQLRVFAYEC